MEGRRRSAYRKHWPKQWSDSDIAGGVSVTLEQEGFSEFEAVPDGKQSGPNEIDIFLLRPESGSHKSAWGTAQCRLRIRSDKETQP